MERSLSRQLATCVEILIARYILHSPWQPKQSQLVALNCSGEHLQIIKSDGASIYALKHTIDFFSLARLRNLFSRKRKITQTP